jgi:hypothetical protein
LMCLLILYLCVYWFFFITVQFFLLFANTCFVPQSMSDVAKFRWVHFFDSR